MNFPLKIFSYLRTCIFVLALLFPSISAAADATMELSPSVGTYSVYDDVVLQVLVSSDDQLVSAVEGRLSYNPKELTVTRLTKDKSIVTSWTQEPTVDRELGTIVFGGALATSTILRGATIITLTVRPERSGEVRLRFEGGAAIISADGLGSNILTSFKSGKYRIKPEELTEESAVPASPTTSSTAKPTEGEVLGATTTHPAPVVDLTPPTDFLLTEVPGREGADPDIVVEFSATDTLSGVAYYTFSVDGGEATRFVDRGTHRYAYRAITPGVHTLRGVAYDHAGNMTERSLVSTVQEKSGAEATDENALLLASVVRTPPSIFFSGILDRHPFLPIMFLLFLLFAWWCVRLFIQTPVGAHGNGEYASASNHNSGSESLALGQVVLAPRIKNNE